MIMALKRSMVPQAAESRTAYNGGDIAVKYALTQAGQDLLCGEALTSEILLQHFLGAFSNALYKVGPEPFDLFLLAVGDLMLGYLAVFRFIEHLRKQVYNAFRLAVFVKQRNDERSYAVAEGIAQAFIRLFIVGRFPRRPWRYRRRRAASASVLPSMPFRCRRRSRF